MSKLYDDEIIIPLQLILKTENELLRVIDYIYKPKKEIIKKYTLSLKGDIVTCSCGDIHFSFDIEHASGFKVNYDLYNKNVWISFNYRGGLSLISFKYKAGTVSIQNAYENLSESNKDERIYYECLTCSELGDYPNNLERIGIEEADISSLYDLSVKIAETSKETV